MIRKVVIVDEKGRALYIGGGSTVDISSVVKSLFDVEAAMSAGSSKTQIVGSDGSVVKVKTDSNTGINELAVNLDGFIDENNSRSTVLLAGATFTGIATNILGYSGIGILVSTDVASATKGLKVEFSVDGSEWHTGEEYTITGSSTKFFTPPPQLKYYRVKYTNGASNQGSFHIHTVVKKLPFKFSSHNINDPIVGEDDAELVKSVITGIRDDGIFGNIVLDNENRIEVSSQPYLYGIAESAISGHTPLLKFGTRTSILAATQSLIWEGTNALYTYLTSAEQLKVSSSSAQDGVGGTGILTLTLVGLDTNFNEITETVTMNGITAVTTTNSFIRIFRAYGATSGSSVTNVGNINITNNAGTNQLVYIPAGDGQTLMTMFTVPAGKVAYLTQITASNDSGKGARFSLYTRLNDGGTVYPWQIKYRAYLVGGNNTIPFNIPFKIPAKTDIEIRFTTPANAGTTSGGSTFELWYENV